MRGEGAEQHGVGSKSVEVSEHSPLFCLRFDLAFYP
jgi:hypothetical protein